MSEQKDNVAVGLQCLDCETLASIVDDATSVHGGTVNDWPEEARIAFRELNRRTEEVG